MAIFFDEGSLRSGGSQIPRHNINTYVASGNAIFHLPKNTIIIKSSLSGAALQLAPLTQLQILNEIQS